MDRHHSPGNPMEPDWAALIRSELEAHSPRRLPSRFRPRQLAEPRQGRRWVRPLAVALAVLLVAVAVAGGAAATQPGGIAGTLQRAVHQLTGRQIGPTPTTAPRRTPGTGVGSSGSPSPGQGVAPASSSAPGSSPAPGSGGPGGGANPGSSAAPGGAPPVGVPVPSLPPPPLPVQPPPLPLP